MLCAFVLLIPDMDEAAKQGWNVFFWAMDAMNPLVEEGALCRDLRRRSSSAAWPP